PAKRLPTALPVHLPSISTSVSYTNLLSGFQVTGACPNDPSNVKCCIKKTCSVSGVGSGNCLNTSNGCSGGSFYTGACPGDSTIKCCIKGGTTTFTGAQVLAKAKTQEGDDYSWGRS